MKRVLVDVDSTLWGFTEELIKRMRVKFPTKTIPDEFDNWDHPVSFFNDFCEALDMFCDIHTDQDTFDPFPHAREMLDLLKEKDYHIHIASNRPSHTIEYLIKWLDLNELPYDSLFCDEDKKDLWDEHEFELVIDDAPKTQLYAEKMGSQVLTLRYKYNEHIQKSCKFNSLVSMSDFIRTEL
jgi:hypothetical protein